MGMSGWGEVMLTAANILPGGGGGGWGVGSRRYGIRICCKVGTRKFYLNSYTFMNNIQFMDQSLVWNAGDWSRTRHYSI